MSSDKKELNIGPNLRRHLGKVLNVDEKNVKRMSFNVVTRPSNTEDNKGVLEFYMEGGNEELVLSLDYVEKTNALKIYGNQFMKRHFPWLEPEVTKEKEGEKDTEDLNKAMADIDDFRSMSCYVLNTFCEIIREIGKGVEIPMSVIDACNATNVTILVRHGYLLYSNENGYTLGDRGIYLRKIHGYVLCETYSSALTSMENIMRELFYFKQLSYELNSSPLVSR